MYSFVENLVWLHLISTPRNIHDLTDGRNLASTFARNGTQVTTSITALAAFEIVKGQRRVPLLSEAQVQELLDPQSLLGALEDGFARLEGGLVQVPPRPEIDMPGAGFSLAMSAWSPGLQVCVKVVNVFEDNLAVGLPNHLAMIMLFSPETGATTCVMDGIYITGLRTAASAVLSAKLLSRPDAKVATIVGAGVQAREHLRLLPLLRNLDRINVCSLEHQHAVRLADKSPQAVARTDLAAAVAEADIVCLTTHSPEQVIDPTWVSPGTHVSSVGYHPPDGELPPDLVRNHRVFVETLDAFLPAPVGCSDLTAATPEHATTLGAVILDPTRGRGDSSEITVYKAMGTAMEDLIAANLAYEAARKSGPPAQEMSW